MAYDVIAFYLFFVDSYASEGFVGTVPTHLRHFDTMTSQQFFIFGIVPALV